MARQAEEWDFDGLLVADSQNLNADVWVELALAAAATRRIALGPGVTNPLTRHLAVTASAAATLQLESGGRAVLGIGRGDSAVTQIGQRPAPVVELERALAMIQRLLRGEEARFGEATAAIRWISDADQPKVPLTVAASGPRVIEAAARHAERVDFTVGAEPARIRWAVDTARAAADGRLSLGAYLNVGVHPDRARARDLVRGNTAVLARFTAEGAPPDGLSDVTREGIDHLASAYEESRHGESDAPAAHTLEDEFIDRFAVCGPADEVADRLARLAELGLDRLIVVPGSLDADPIEVEKSNSRFATEVLPALAKGAASAAPGRR